MFEWVAFVCFGNTDNAKEAKEHSVKWELIRVDQSWCLSSRKTTSPAPGIYMEELPVSGHTVRIVMTDSVAEAMMINDWSVIYRRRWKSCWVKSHSRQRSGLQTMPHSFCSHGGCRVHFRSWSYLLPGYWNWLWNLPFNWAIVSGWYCLLSPV